PGSWPGQRSASSRPRAGRVSWRSARSRRATAASSSGSIPAVARLAGLNAQDPEPPYLTLWARLAGFERDALTRALEDRSVVRGSLLRGTQHMATAARPRSCSPSPGSAGPWPPRPRPGT
ncbi:MAG: DNA glycosylase AlkZ-like family protein, partial [Actinomycetota bacterium]